MEIKVPELSLVVLIGVSGSGKTSFARKHFIRSEIISSDECRALVSNDENDQAATKDAFELIHYIVGKRLKNGLLTVIDATSVQREARKSLVELARTYHCLPVAIVLDVPEKICRERNEMRPDRDFGDHVIRNQSQQLKRSLRGLKQEGFRHIFVLRSAEEIDAVTAITREKLYNNKRDESGPFDIIGDVHGCFDELHELLEKLGYVVEKIEPNMQNFGFSVTAPEGRRAVFVGDLVDRGPNSPGVLRLAMSMVNSGAAICVPGNHEFKLQKYLRGKNVQLKHGLEITVGQLEAESEEFKNAVAEFIYGLVSHYVFDDGKLVVAHAGLKEEMQGRGSGAVRSFCMYGETTGETDEFGLPVRYNWAKEYRGKAKVVYGHSPVPEAEWLNRTIDIDTGCVFGGKLTALRYPEEEIVAVAAKQVYYDPIRPLDAAGATNGLSPQQEYDDLLNIEDVTGKRIVQTRLRHNITIREENSIAALEVMSRFAVDPKWLIYLPPTMSPCETSDLPNFLEHPAEALEYYAKHGVEKVICEEKHMGSRAVIIVCRDEKATLERFGIADAGIGVCYTRTGRKFFSEESDGQEFIARVNAALTMANFWEKFKTDWVCLDTELMPWSAKAQKLLQQQYAAVGAAAGASLPEAESTMRLALNRGIKDIEPLLDKISAKYRSIEKYRAAYRNYCWPVAGLDDLKLAPFHILATEGRTHIDKDHSWHMESIAEICRADEMFMATPYKIVELADKASYDDAVNWWIELTSGGGEGMVVKPFDFVAFDRTELLQPAVKCRGSEYLRIIYGPEYDAVENISRLKSRGLSRKRSLGLREFALGIEGLERFVKKEPLRRVHESVFGVLALESEDVDPRL